MRFETVGVVGAGVMGAGVAQALAQTGHRVVLLDLGPEQLERARSEIRQALRMQALLQRPAAGKGAAGVLEQIRFTADYGDLSAVDFVVENVPERWAVKETVYRQLDAVCPASVIFAANTSCISITRIASVTRRPAQVVGMHFMNPVPLKPMVELVRGLHTSDETLDAARDFLAGLGKDSIVVKDRPGFVTNRVLMLSINEAILVVEDQVAPPEDVDRLFKTCFGHKMGPLETADLIGLDTILLSLEVLRESYHDDKYRPAPLLRKMVDAGFHGRKSGRGFYNYEPTIA